MITRNHAGLETRNDARTDQIFIRNRFDKISDQTVALPRIPCRFAMNECPRLCLLIQNWIYLTSPEFRSITKFPEVWRLRLHSTFAVHLLRDRAWPNGANLANRRRIVQRWRCAENSRKWQFNANQPMPASLG